MEINEIKQRLSIIEVARHLNISIGRNGRALCPFHDDKTPSLQFSKEKNICTCFSSSCKAGTMDIIQLTEKKLNLSTHGAIMQLKEWAGHLNGNGSQPKHNPEMQQIGKIALLTKVFNYFENGIKTSARAKAYLESRGLVQATPQTPGIELGFNSGSFYQRANKHLIESSLQHGLIYESKGNKGGYISFAKDCLVFPLKNKENKISGLYYRSINDKAENKHFYLKDREGLYPHCPKPGTKQLIITEAIIDAATILQTLDFRQKTLENTSVLASYGTNGLTEEHVKVITELQQLKETIFFFDGDNAGKEGIKKQAAKLKQVLPNLQISMVNTPEGEDVNSLYINHQDKAKELFVHLLGSRTPFLPSIEKEETIINPSSIETIQEVNNTPIPSTENPSNEEKKEAAPAAAPNPSTHSPTNPSTQLDSTDPNRIIYKTATALYIAQGGIRPEVDSLKITLIIEAHKTQSFKYRNKLDLYENRQVERAAREAAEKLGLRADMLEMDLNRFTDLLEELRDRQLEAKGPVKQEYIMDSSTAAKCKEFLSKPNLTQRLNGLIGKAGVTGEENNRLFLLLIASSYKMHDTLHALIQGSSGSGKTHLLAKISSFIPQEDRKQFTRVTDSSFYNYGMYDLQNKLICLEDLDGMKEEAQLAFRELQSRGMLSSSTTGQDEKGNIRSIERIVYGPVASLACTTKGEIYEDNMSRCFLIAVDEGTAQTQKIIAYQNARAAGAINAKEEKETAGFITSCIRILKPYQVINPYAGKVQLPEEAHKIRRLNDLYQSFVKQVTLFNQYQRKQDKEGRLIAQKEDLQTAAEIMFESILLKIDELDGSLRQFYEKLKEYIQAKGGEHYSTYSFTQIEVRQAFNISKSQIHRYIQSLIDLEYIQIAGGFINRGYRYKINYWDNINNLRAKVKRHLQGQLDQLEIM